MLIGILIFAIILNGISVVINEYPGLRALSAVFLTISSIQLGNLL